MNEETAGGTSSLGRRLLEVAWGFLPLGWVAFGGPQAHIALLQDRFVFRSQWLDEQRFAELLGMGQGLPGPTSTQMVVAVGTVRAGPLGGMLAFLCFVFPAATIMTLAGLGAVHLVGGVDRPVWLELGVLPATVALVAVAAWRLGRTVINSRTTMALMLMGAVAAILWSRPWIFPAVLVLGGLTTLWTLRNEPLPARDNPDFVSDSNLSNLGIPWPVGALLLLVFLGLLAGLILARLILDWAPLELFESFYRMGSLIFGGGQVVLPMMLTEVVETGLVTEQQFLEGFALMLALPGPLFSFSAYLGAVSGGILGALIAFLAMFLPGILIIFAVLPFWERARRHAMVGRLLTGVNATAIGLVVAAVFLLWERAVSSPQAAAMALLAFGSVAFFRAPAPLVILGSGVLGWGYSLL